MKLIKGNILDAQEPYIAQQCNCLTVTAHGLSQTLADKWPWANAYSHRRRVGNRNLAIEEDRDLPGTIKVLSSTDQNEDKEGKNIICMFGQWGPSSPLKYKSYPDYDIDTYENRKKWFQECLDHIKDLDIKEIAFPFKIGCGLARGNWTHYQKMIEDFESTSSISCTLYMI